MLCLGRGSFTIDVVVHIPKWLERLIVFVALLYRRIRFGYSFRKIPLTQGQFAIVDSADYPRLAKYKWRLCKTKGKNVTYAERSVRLPNGKYSRILMHREVLNPYKAQDPNHYSRVTSHERRVTNLVIDHINGSGLDNRRANLRLATVAQNAWNSKKRSSRCGYKGVWFARDKGLWRAAIVCNRRRIHLGYFRDKHAAARAYDKAARTHFGEYAVLNFPTLYSKKS